MDSVTLALILTLLVTCIWIRFARKPCGPPPRLPLGPPRLPIFGNLLQLGPLHHRNFASFCPEYGPLVYLRLGNVDAITTNDPEVIREILVNQDDVFASRPRTLAAVHVAYNFGDVALAPLGARWKRMRRICMEHLLTTWRLESFAAHRAREADNLVREVLGTGARVDLRRVLCAFSMNNVTRMLLGKQWFDPFGGEKKMREVEMKVDQFHERIIDEQRKVSGADKGEMDFFDVLLSFPGEEGKEHMDDEEIKALIQVERTATDTSSVTNEWAMVEVIKHPHVLRRVQEELDLVVGQD
ncbi:Flavonoid 3'-monooxygenase [Acorus calamus]|uniref:Flavonoid 3'-monooxygenase n=1 Tax=Acorus calamus TaxID=4465 RepID=A0AAV9E1T8_ACOCL|nr:Flavonoid 3'-monooxygenase [Acorus calamus]